MLESAIFDAFATQEPGVGAEIQLTDAIAAGIAETVLSGFAFSGTRFDCGSRQGMLAAELYLAQQDPAFDGVLDSFISAHSAATAA